jgi:S-adenosyl-L-methionine hydrolase (adenosine-forming)
MALVTLTTDFGLRDPFVGIMKGVILSRAPQARLVDLTHDIGPQDVLAGALVLRHATPYFPAGTIHVAVVDPGVGGSRRPLCVETTAGLLVGPDNGLLSLAAPPAEVRGIIHLTDERFFLSPRSATFHGRDVFAPVAAALACGTPPAALGAPADDLVRLDVPEPHREAGAITGRVLYADHFGNLVTNVPESALADLDRGRLTLRAGSTVLTGIHGSYASVATGHPVAVVGSWGLVELAVRDGSARAALGLDVGDGVRIEIG